MMKYCPKYYQSLTLKVTRQSSLLSKVKKIKKLKKFTGLFKDNLPQKLWFVLLANHRKEIEEIPEMIPIGKDPRLPRFFRKQLSLQKIKFFFNVKSLSFSSRLSNQRFDSGHWDYLESIKELFVRYVRNLRRLKTVEASMAKWIFEKLGRMSRFLNRLEKFKVDIANPESKVLELLESKQTFLHVTDLDLYGKFYSVFSRFPESCKNLRSLSFDFSSLADQKTEFLHFLTSLQGLPRLISLKSVWQSEVMHLWGYFKPQSSLRYLKLKFKDLNLNQEEAVTHWEEIKELDELELDIFCWKAQDILLMRRFITMILKKVQKLRSLKLSVSMDNLTGKNVVYQPFFIEEVPHLYESLERFEHTLHLWGSNDLIRFDLEIMKPFANLKELKLEGRCDFYENVEKSVILLEKNQKKGEYPVLELNLRAREEEKDWLRITLEKIGAVKRVDRNLKTLISLSYDTNSDFEDLFEDLYSRIQSIKMIKGLVVRLSLFESADNSVILDEKIREVLNKYPQQIRNLMVKLENTYESLEYIKIDGEKEQTFHDRSWLEN